MRWYHDPIYFGILLGTSVAGWTSGPSVSTEVALLIPFGIQVLTSLGLFIHCNYLIKREVN